MTKVLLLHGDDYAAMTIEDEVGVEKAYQKAVENGGEIELFDYMYATAYVFKEVDARFIEFMEDNFVDYDVSKTRNFHIIK